MEKNSGKVREFCHSGKVGTLSLWTHLEVMSLLLSLSQQYKRTLNVVEFITPSLLPTPKMHASLVWIQTRSHGFGSSRIHGPCLVIGRVVSCRISLLTNDTEETKSGTKSAAFSISTVTKCLIWYFAVTSKAVARYWRITSKVSNLRETVSGAWK